MAANRWNPSDPVSMFNDLVGIPLQRDLLRGIVAEYGVSYAECSERLSPPTLDDVLPHYRRGKIEELFVEIGGRMEGCTVRTQQNKAGNCSHNLLFIGENIVLTQSKVDDRHQLPRDALFRGTYARSPQALFAFMEDDTSSVSVHDDALYGIITHSPSEMKCLPLFVDIVFPDPKCEFIIDAIPLMETFPDVLKEVVPAEEVVHPEITQKLRLKQTLRADATA